MSKIWKKSSPPIRMTLRRFGPTLWEWHTLGTHGGCLSPSPVATLVSKWRSLCVIGAIGRGHQNWAPRVRDGREKGIFPPWGDFLLVISMFPAKKMKWPPTVLPFKPACPEFEPSQVHLPFFFARLFCIFFGFCILYLVWFSTFVLSFFLYFRHLVWSYLGLFFPSCLPFVYSLCTKLICTYICIYRVHQVTCVCIVYV